MSESTQQSILEAASMGMREGESVSLDSVARRVGLTKAGVMHYFRTKEALMLGLVDHVAARWEAQLGSFLADPIGDASPEALIRAYVDYALGTDFDDTDVVMLSDPRLREPLAQRWREHAERWTDLPTDMPAEKRARLLAARLIADGAWFASATNVLAPTRAEREHVRAIAYQLLEN